MTAGPRQILSPLAIKGRVARPQPKGLPVIGMGFNELPFGPTERVAEAIAEVGRRPNRYGEPTCRALREAIAGRFGLDPDEIICGNGSEELLDLIARSFVRPGDEIVFPEFGYIQFPIVANRLNARPAKAREGAYATNIDSILSVISDKTGMIFLANPNNPTGTAISAAEIARLADEAPTHVPIVIDLAYGEFLGLDHCAAVHDLVAARPNLIVTRTFSKAFGLAGLRVGWAHAPRALIPGFYAARAMGPVNAMAQAAAVAALADMDAAMARVDWIVAERERMRAALDSAGVETLDSRANFLLCRFRSPDAPSPDEFVEALYDATGIVVIGIREAGLEAFFRVSVSAEDHNDLFLEFVSGLQC